MALVNGGFLHYMDMKKFLKNFFLQNRWSDFEIISQECFLGDLFQKSFAKFWPVNKYGCGELGLFALYRHEEIHVCIVQKNLVLRNHMSDFEIISQESGFDISRRPDCPIRAVIATGKLPWPFVSPLFLVCYCQFWSLLQIPVVFGLWDLKSKWILNCLQNLFKKRWSIKKHGFYGRLDFLFWYKVKSLKAF